MADEKKPKAEKAAKDEKPAKAPKAEKPAAAAGAPAAKAERAPKGKGADKGGDKGGDKAVAKGKAKAAPGGGPVRMRSHYDSVVRKALTEKFGYKNGMQVPAIDKIVLNMGIG